MRVIAPDAAPSTRSRTISGTLRLLRPGAPDLVDAAFGFALGVVALLGLSNTFASGRYLAVGAAGLLIGAACAHVTTVLRGHWAWAPALAAVSFYLLGGALALPVDALGGFLPTPATLAGLTALAVGGWKDLLTTLPPVDGDGEFLVLVWLYGLALGTVGHLVARRSKAPWLGPVVPLLGVAGVILLGTFEGAAVPFVGVAATVLAFAWLVVRYTRRRRLAGTGMGATTRWVSAALLLAVALAGGTALTALMPGPQRTPRVVLRTYVQPPVDVDKYPSPLAGFRKYSSDSQALYDQPLLAVAGASAGSLVRFAVLDDYTGTVWSASGGGVGDGGSGFQRVGSQLPGAPVGQTNTVRLTILSAYAATADLNVWLPAPGPATQIVFTGEHAREHQAEVRYNVGTGQALVPDGLKAGDAVEVTSVALGDDAGALPRASGAVVVGEAQSAFMTDPVDRLGERAGDPWSRALEIARVLRTDGAWSNGTEPGEQQYLPGHGTRRLTLFTTELVGSDEHFAAAYALALNRLGYPARVVLGATVGADGQVRGRDVRAWVEVSLDGAGWVTIPTETFMPDRSKQPTTLPPKTSEQRNAPDVPQPNPARPPGSFDSLFDAGGTGDRADDPAKPEDWWRGVLAVLAVAGPPLALVAAVCGAILGAKAWRRHRRRTTGAATTRVAGGWLEFLDRARDLGRAVPARATRVEQAAAVGGAEASALARGADRLVFGPGTPDEGASGEYWASVASGRAALVAGLPWWRRWAVALNPRSLVAPASARRPMRRSR